MRQGRRHSHFPPVKGGACQGQKIHWAGARRMDRDTAGGRGGRRMKPAILQIPVGQMANFTYIIADEESGDAAIIDPSWDLDEIFHTLKKNGWRAKYVINTHTHFDHVLGNDQVAGLVG